MAANQLPVDTLALAARRWCALLLAGVVAGTPSVAVNAHAQTAPPPTPTTPAAEGDGGDFTFEIVEEQAQDVDAARLEGARDALEQERFADAVSGFEAILGDAKLKRFHQQVEYELAKAFYRMGAFHAAIERFRVILEAGPRHPQFASARGWLFFLSKKMKDELLPLGMVATYAKSEDIPAAQQSELSYALARYHFLNALNQGAQGVDVEPTPEPPAPEPTTPAEPPTEDNLKLELELENDKKPADKDSKDEGLNFSADDLGGGDDDGFGFDFSDDKKPADKDKKAKDKKAKDKKQKKEPAKDDKKAKPDVVVKDEPPPPPPSPAGKFKNADATTADQSLALAETSIGRVGKEFVQYPQAVYLKGLVHFAKGEFEPSVAAFREVVRMTNPKKDGGVKNAKLREMAFFSLARVHYQFEQFRYAIFYYDRISRDSVQWLDAVFESSWAHFRLGEFEKALGNLVTLQSPFFLDEYYPESSILKAITFYENCRYPEARAFLDEFNQNYGGIVTELNRLVGEGAVTKSAEELFNELTALEAKVEAGKDDAARTIALTARLVRLALSDKRVANYREAISEIDEEKNQLSALGGSFGGGALQTALQKSLDDRRAALVSGGGDLLREKLLTERKFLEELTAKLVRIKFEIAKMEKAELEASMTDQNQAVAISGYNFTAATDDERTFWPFDGEYWRDELGTYQYTLTRGCRPPSETTITGN
jgi:tetratricopeptide (TPR) repeat protein